MRIWVAGHRGMVGSAIGRALRARGYNDLTGVPRAQLDLTEQAHVRRFLKEERPDYVFMAAGLVGGIQANSKYPGAFLSENLSMATNVILESFAAGVEGLCYLGSSCMYPRECPQPMREEYLLTGAFEPTNSGYGLAKAAGARLTELIGGDSGRGADYCCAVPCNLYGPDDTYDPERSHILPALIRRAHECKGRSQMTVWGSGKPLREFLHADDLARACVLLMERRAVGMYNVGSGKEISTLEAAQAVCRAVGFEGELVLDASKPDGMPRKLMDSERIRGFGWSPEIGLEEGLRGAYQNFTEFELQRRTA